MNSSICLIAARRLRQPRTVGERQQRIGADPVLGHQVAVEVGDAQQVLRARIAALGGGLDIGQRLFAAAVLEQQQAVVVGGLDMPLRRGARVERFGLLHILAHARARGDRPGRG